MDLSSVIVLITVLDSARPVLLRYTKESLVYRAEQLPTKLESKEDIRTVERVLTEESKTLPIKESSEIAQRVVDATYYDWKHFHAERLRQARVTFNVALALVALGALIIFTGVVFIFAGYVSAGAVTTGVGAISEIVSVLLFRLNSESNDRLDSITRDLTILDKTRIAMRYIDQITDETKRNEAIADLAKDLQATA